MTADYDQAAQDDLWAFMHPQPADEGRRLRDEGAQQALDGADTRARLAGEKAIRDLARSGREFTSDDVHELVGHPLGASTAVMGSLFLTSAQAGLIEHVGYRQSRRREAHGRVVKTWRGTGKVVADRPQPKKPESVSVTDSADPRLHDATPATPDRTSRRREVSAGTWTTADTPAPCVRCNRPAFMRLDGAPRHRADCNGAA